MAKYKNLTARILVALVAIPVILWLTMLGGYYFFIFVMLLSSIALFEFYGLAKAKGAAPLKILGLIFGACINAVFIYERAQVDIYQFILSNFKIHIPLLNQNQLLLYILIILVLLVMLIELFRRKGSPTLNISSTILGVLAISLCLGLLTSLRELFSFGFPVQKYITATDSSSELAKIDRWGGYTVIAIFASIWICDTAAYFGGKAYGKHKLFASVSPNKTWEGAIFGFFFSIITFVAAKILLLDFLSYQHAIAMGVLIGIFGQIGDLIESRFKRDAGVKDSSSVIPGHGGVYDRFDSLIYVSPIVYLYIDFFVLS